MKKSNHYLTWSAQIIAAFILAQTLFFKFTAHAESVALFTQLGAEPWGRIGSGIVELIAVVLLLVPRTAAVGGLLAAGVMVGAIGAHLTKLGIVMEDGGPTLFVMAVITFVSGLIVAFRRRTELPLIGGHFRASVSQ